MPDGLLVVVREELRRARVSGLTSGPTLICTAALPALNRAAKPVMDGCSAYWRATPRLSNGAVVGTSKVAASAALAWAMPPAVWLAPPPRMVLYWL